MDGSARSLHPSMQKLLGVQKLDCEIRFLSEAMRLRPQELEDDRRKVATCQALVANAEDALRECRLEIDRGELEIKGCDGEIEKANVALNSAKTNQEYAVLKAQIERHEDTRGEVEERVLEALTRLDGMQAEKAKIDTNLAAQQRAFARKEGEVHEIVAGLRKQVAELQATRAQLVVDIEPDHLELYERILAHVGDAAIVQVKDSTCHGCFMQVTKQDRAVILVGEKLVQCKNCSRLLFL